MTLPEENIGENTLCEHCKLNRRKRCEFDMTANAIANNRNKSPWEKHLEIANERVLARNRNCPFLNEINPDYKGKEKL